MASLLWGTIGVVTYYFRDADPFVAVMIRGSVAGLLVITWRTVSGKSSGLPDRNLFYLGVTMALFFNTYIFTIDTIGPDLSAVFLYTALFFVYLWEVVKGRSKVDIKGVSASVLTVLGVYATSNAPHFTVLDLTLGLASGATYASLILHSDYLQRRGKDEWDLLGWPSIFASLLSLPLALPVLTVTPEDLELGVYLGLVASVSAYVFFYRGLRQTNATVATGISALEPVFTVILAYLFLGIFIYPLQELGALMVVVSVVLFAF